MARNARGRISGPGPGGWGRGGPEGRKAHHQPRGMMQSFPKGQRAGGVNEDQCQLSEFSSLLRHLNVINKRQTGVQDVHCTLLDKNS